MTDPDPHLSFGVSLGAPRLLAELTKELGGRPDDEIVGGRVERVVSPEHALYASDLVVVTRIRAAPRAKEAKGILLVQSELAARLPRGSRWIHPHAAWVVAELLEPVAKRREALSARPAAIGERAVVEPGAHVDATAILGEGAIVLSGARVGPGCRIGPRAILYGGVVLGARVVVGPGAIVGHPGFGWTAGPSGELFRVPQLGGVLVEDDVEIGALATVDAGTLSPTILRRRVKLDAHVHVAHNVEIGEGCLVAAQSGFAGSSRIGAGVLVGGQAGVTDHAEIGRGARIAAKSGVIGDVAPGAVVAGFPAVPRLRWLRAWANLLRREQRRKQ